MFQNNLADTLMASFIKDVANSQPDSSLLRKLMTEVKSCTGKSLCTTHN